MEKALILTGKVDDNESYQLLVGCSYISGVYDHCKERDEFYDELSDTFVGRILQEGSSLELGVFNGLRINPETGKNEKIQKLEDIFVGQFSQLVCEKLKHSPIQTLPACIRN